MTRTANVGICGNCGQRVILYATSTQRYANCPCHQARIPMVFFRHAAGQALHQEPPRDPSGPSPMRPKG